MQKGRACRQAGFIIPALPLMVIVLILAVGGVFYLNKSNISKVLSPTSFVKITPSPTPDETANWKTYTNIISGYSLKYPTDILEACKDKTGVPFVLENIEELANKQPEVIKNLRTNFQEGECLPPLGGSGYSIEIWARIADPESVKKIEALYQGQGNKIIVDGAIGILETGSKSHYSPSLGGDKFKQITIYKNGKIYSLYLNHLKYEKIFDQILSTFKFLSASSAGGDQKDAEGKVCGGFGGEKGQFACPVGYKCKYPEPMYPDAQGQCVRSE